MGRWCLVLGLWFLLPLLVGQGCDEVPVLPEPPADSPGGLPPIPAPGPIPAPTPIPPLPPLPPITPPAPTPELSDLARIEVYDLSDDMYLSGKSLYTDNGMLVGNGGYNDKELWVGFDVTSREMYHSFFRWKAVGKPRAARAEVWLYCLQAATSPPPLFLEQPTQDWGAFTFRIPADPASRQQLLPPRTGEWYVIDVTTWHNEWRENRGPTNFGCQLRAIMDKDNPPRFSQWAEFVSSDSRNSTHWRPRLVIVREGGPLPVKLRFPLDGRYSPARVSGYRFGDWWEKRTCASFPSVLLQHLGTDFGASVNDPVYAVADGEVIYAQADEKQGGYVVLAHSNNTYTSSYVHVWPTVLAGTSVTRGLMIATVAPSTTYGPHLHFSLRDKPPVGDGVELMARRGAAPSSSCVIVTGEKPDPSWPNGSRDSEYAYWE